MYILLSSLKIDIRYDTENELLALQSYCQALIWLFRAATTRARVLQPFSMFKKSKNRKKEEKMP